MWSSMLVDNRDLPQIANQMNSLAIFVRFDAVYEGFSILDGFFSIGNWDGFMIFVTGGVGFIGANFILDWLGCEGEVV